MLLGLAGIVGMFVATLVILRVLGLIRAFFVPTAAMAPTIDSGDQVMMEAFTFLARKPGRGDVVVFETDGIMQFSKHPLMYVRRIAGEPGDRLRISEGKLFINDKQVAISNAEGEIAYHLPPGAEGLAKLTNVTVPVGKYYVLGDNSTDSADSRLWGFVPAENILGRVAFRYWPPQRIGGVK